MEKIEIEGREYEVLPLDRISEVTHAKLAGGIHEADCLREFIHVYTEIGDADCVTTFNEDELPVFGIQPLKLLPKVPVEFEATFAKDKDGKWYPIYCLDDGLGYQGYEQRQFRCVEVTE